jgi:hypothetical protein
MLLDHLFAYQLILVAAPLTLAVALAVVVKFRPGMRRTANFLLALVSLATLYAAAELFIIHVHHPTDGRSYSLASQLWFRKHWKPVNKHNLRDRRETFRLAPSQRTTFVVGDSLVAGHGIKDIGDRFSDILDRRLGPGHAVYNMGVLGWHTGQELQTLAGLGRLPDSIILVHYVNDIDSCEEPCGTGFTSGAKPDWGAFTKIVNHSFVLNLLYVRLARTQATSQNYMEYLHEAYDDPCCWSVHRQYLNAMVALCERQNTELIAVVMPQLNDIAGSLSLVRKVAGVFESHGVETINVTQMIKDVPTGKLVVNSSDAHPSVWLNKVLASVLYDALTGQVDIHDPKHLDLQ